MEKRLRKLLPNGAFGKVTTKRSRQMATVRGSGNKSTESRLRFAMVGAGLRGWKLRPKHLPGKPDFFFPKQGVAVFVDGCFWHGCPRCGHLPKANSAFWREKILGNQERDLRVRNLLTDQGINVIRFWEHELAADLNSCLAKVAEAVNPKA